MFGQKLIIPFMPRKQPIILIGFQGISKVSQAPPLPSDAKIAKRTYGTAKMGLNVKIDPSTEPQTRLSAQNKKCETNPPPPTFHLVYMHIQPPPESLRTQHRRQPL
jgi:hypothetical protein